MRFQLRKSLVKMGLISFPESIGVKPLLKVVEWYFSCQEHGIRMLSLTPCWERRLICLQVDAISLLYVHERDEVFAPSVRCR